VATSAKELAYGIYDSKKGPRLKADFTALLD
jgi:hypothetical protein